jgi:formylmethanofuran dehydrogenase subunit B
MQKITDVVCPACGCVCDDLTLTVDNNQLVDVQPDCPLAERWFRDNSHSAHPAVQIEGNEATLDEGLARAASIVLAAKYPLVYGLARSSTPGQRAAVELADQLGAVIDTTASLCHGPSIMALQNVGESTCSLGEIRNRSDLVIFWGCNPAETHPRHAERYSVFPRGQFVPEGRAGRTVVMIGDAQQVHDWRLDRNDSKPDIVIPVTSGCDFEAIAVLRMLLKGLPVDASTLAETGASHADLQMLAERMKACRSGVVFFGLGLTGTSFDHPTSDLLGHTNVECLLRMVAELNAFTRFYARRMRLQGDVSGADSVLCWQTGYPFSVNLSRGYPRYNPGEYSADDLLKRREPDACLLIGTETVQAFSEESRQHLRTIPTIVLDYPAAQLAPHPALAPTVHFTTAPYGLFAEGTIYRMDEIPLQLRSYLKGSWPTDESVLRQLIALTRLSFRGH